VGDVIFSVLRRFCRLRRSGFGAPHVTPTAPEDSNEPQNTPNWRRAYLDEYTADFHRILRAFHVHTTYLSIYIHRRIAFCFSN
jgi:hypothetical protein